MLFSQGLDPGPRAVALSALPRRKQTLESRIPSRPLVSAALHLLSPRQVLGILPPLRPHFLSQPQIQKTNRTLGASAPHLASVLGRLQQDRAPAPALAPALALALASAPALASALALVRPHRPRAAALVWPAELQILNLDMVCSQLTAS